MKTIIFSLILFAASGSVASACHGVQQVFVSRPVLGVQAFVHSHAFVQPVTIVRPRARIVRPRARIVRPRARIIGGCGAFFCN